MAARNGMVIRKGLHRKLGENDDYIMKELDKYGQYYVYSITRKQERRTGKWICIK
jgi:hypothetical protein